MASQGTVRCFELLSAKALYAERWLRNTGQGTRVR